MQVKTGARRQESGCILDFGFTSRRAEKRTVNKILRLYAYAQNKVSLERHRSRRDGLRILATRFRGRGMPASRYDVWMPSLGPGERLLKAGRAGQISWAQFLREYRRELFMDGPVDARSKTIKNHGQKFTLRLIKRLARRGSVTLMCHCSEEEDRCHRHALRELIMSYRVCDRADRCKARLRSKTV